MVQGSEAQVAHATTLINGKINEGGPASSMQDAGPMTVLDCPKTVVGRVIGRGGETINLLQQRSGARIQIDQKVPEGAPCKVQICGNPQVTEVAVRMVTDIMNGGPTPSGGGQMGGHGGQMGGYGGQMGGYGGQMGGYAGGGYGGQMGGYGGHMGGYGGGYGGQMGGYGAQYGGAYGQQQQQHGQQQAYAQAAPAAATSAWSEHDDGSGNKYWYNASTGQSQWERPADA